MRFIDRPLSKLTPTMCDDEEKRAKAAHAAYATAVRAMKRLIEAKADLGDMGDMGDGNPAEGEIEEDNG